MNTARHAETCMLRREDIRPATAVNRHLRH
nr:MAG TPA: hypothetical protein [Caudoviricetes sp.]